MQVQPDAITRVLGIQEYHVEDCEVGDAEIHLRIERDCAGHRCPRCKQVHLWCYDSQDRTVQDLPMSGKRVFLTFRQHRVE